MKGHGKQCRVQQFDPSEDRLNQSANATLTLLFHCRQSARSPTTHLLSLQTREPHLLPGMRRIRRSGWESAARRLQLMEHLINLNATVSGRTSISLRLSGRLFISLSEIGWRRLVGGRRLAALVPSGGTDVPGTIRVFQGKKKKKHSP